MATNLIAEIMNEFRGDTLKGVASAVGETPEKTGTALGGVFTSLIGGLVNNTTTSDQASSLLNVIRSNKLDTGPFTDISSAIRTPGNINSLISMGRPLLDSLFGTRVGGITDWVSSLSGIGRGSSSSLLGMALPLVLGQIGKRVLGSGGTASSLLGLLADQRQFLRDAPAGLATVLGEPVRRITTDEGAARRAAYESESRRPAVAGPYHKQPTRSAWLWALPVLALIPLLMFLMSRRNEVPRQAVIERSPVVETTPAPDLPRPIGTGGAVDLGVFVDRRLPNNVMLRIPARGVERMLIEYVEDPTQVPSREKWFSFDRVEFETDSATLRPSANEQLQNIASILKAYPSVKIKVGGYTDNTASPAYNLKLSQDRANAAMNQIVVFGVDRSRLSAEGYGEAHPVADNSTADGRQRNRRVDIRVTEK